MLIGLFIQLVVKGFTDLENVGTERASALYFYANIVTALILLAAFCISTSKKNVEDGVVPSGIIKTVKTIPLRLYILIPITATIANIPCVTNAYCLMNMDLSIFTIVTKAAESLVFFSISRFIFIEKSSQ